MTYHLSYRTLWGVQRIRLLLADRLPFIIYRVSIRCHNVRESGHGSRVDQGDSIRFILRIWLPAREVDEEISYICVVQGQHFVPHYVRRLLKPWLHGLFMTVTDTET